MTDAGGRIVVDRVTKLFGTVHAVEDLSFTVEPGTVTGFLGPNGAGKTTTMRVVLGLAEADVRGPRRSPACRTRSCPTRAGWSAPSWSSTSFHPARSALNHLRVYAAAAGVERRTRRRGARPGRTVGCWPGNR